MGIKKEVAKNNILNTSSSIYIAVVGFVFNLVLARLLEPFDFGLFSFSLTVLSFFSIFATWGVGLTVTRFTADFIAKNKYAQAKTTIFLGIKYRTVISILLGTSITILSPQIALMLFVKPETTLAVLMAGILIILESIVEIFSSIFSALKNFKYISLTKILDKTFKAVFAIWLVLFGLSYFGALVGLVIGNILMLFVSVYLLKRFKFLSVTRKKINKKIFITFGMWVFVGGLGAILFNTIDSLMISIFLSIQDVGFYRIAFTWAFALTTLFPISSLVLFPYFSSSKKIETQEIFGGSLKYGMMIIIPLAFILSAFASPVIAIFYEESYLPAADALSILSIATIPLLISSMLVSYFSGINKQKMATKITTIAVVLNIVLNYFFILNFGILGAAIATLISRVFESVIMLVMSRSTRLGINASNLWKPLLASLFTYTIATFLVVGNVLSLIIFSIASMGIYICIMVAIKGISKDDINVIRSFYNDWRNR